MSTEGEAWHIDWDRGRTRLVLTIEGHLSAEEGQYSAERFVEQTAGRDFELVADLSGMLGYDRGAREAWQSALSRQRSQISAVYFVGLGPIFRMAAATVCLGARIRAHFHETLDEIPKA